MNVTYQRNGRGGYLVLHEQNAGDRGLFNRRGYMAYDKEMVLRNAIGGLLPCQMVTVDGERQYLYDITHMQSLHFYCERQMLTYDVLWNFILGMARMQEETMRYLLKDEKILYGPEYVYMDASAEMVRFCYDLRDHVGEEAKTMMQGLLEYLLMHIDHRDERQVSLMYDLYDASRDVGFSLREYLEERRTERDADRIADRKKEELTGRASVMSTPTDLGDVAPSSLASREIEDHDASAEDWKMDTEEKCVITPFQRVRGWMTDHLLKKEKIGNRRCT